MSITPVPITVPLGREPMSFLLVRIELDDGTIGWGEGCDSYGCSYASVVSAVITEVFSPLLVGQPLVAVDPLPERLLLFTRRRLGDGWIAAHARSAVELALHDALGRATGVSASVPLGRVCDRVAVYASSVFLEEGEALWHYELLAPLLDRGVTMVKVRTGPNWAADLETLAALRTLLPETIELMVDGSDCYTLPTALEIAGRLADLDVRWFEEPIPQPRGGAIEELVARSAVPIAYGEHLFGPDGWAEAIARRRFDVFQPDAATIGGLAEARRAARAAATAGLRVVPHVCAGPLALAANLHLAATVPAIRAVEYPFTLAPVWAAVAPDAPLGPVHLVDGTLAVPDGPGLGIMVDEAALAAHPYRPPGARVAGTTGGLPDRFTGDR